MRKLLISMFVLLALTSFAFADQTCYVDEICPLETIVYNSTFLYNGTVTTTVLDGSAAIILNQEMQQVINNSYIYYSYNYTFSKPGSYLRFSVANSRLGDEQIIVEENYSKNTYEEMKMIIGNLIFWVALIALIGITLFKMYNVMNQLRYKDKGLIWILNIVANLSFLISWFYVMSNPQVLSNQAFMLGIPFLVLMWLFTIIENVLITKNVAIDKDYSK